ncbi:MAG: hypothetical protein ABF624_02070 [Liquorilactobacillus ghanensis]|uniref:hypothetical protein n=1 Tax=Liquorilactobacillus ghanensis TaxID=399370 RepID=UPI0039ED165C
MKFYEFEEPYYALIKASNEKEAIKNYLKEVCEDDEDERKFHEITFKQAIEEVKSAIAEEPQDFFENWDSMVTDKAVEFLKENNLSAALIDSSLL